MADQATTVEALRDLYRRFVAERDWEQFHSPKNLVMCLAVEVAELMEHFLWMDNDASRAAANNSALREAIADEVADVTGLVLCLCNTLDLDLSSTIVAKMEKNVRKYPAEQYRGRYKL